MVSFTLQVLLVVVKWLRSDIIFRYMALSVLIKQCISLLNFTYQLLFVSNIWNLWNKIWKAYGNLKKRTIILICVFLEKVKVKKKKHPNFCFAKNINTFLQLSDCYQYFAWTVLSFLRQRLWHDSNMRLNEWCHLELLLARIQSFTTSIGIFPLNSNSKFYEIITYCL